MKVRRSNVSKSQPTIRSQGTAIREARISAGLTQRDLAAKIVQENGERGISPAYLNDIEHDRRRPSSSHILTEIARALRMDSDYLLLMAGQVPSEMSSMISRVDERTYRDAFRLFREALRKKPQA